MFVQLTASLQIIILVTKTHPLASLRRLLSRQLGLHPSTRRQNHLVSSLLQRCVTLLAVRTPSFALLLGVVGILDIQLIPQVISSNQIWLRRLLRLSRRRRCAGASRGLTWGRGRLEGNRGLEAILSTMAPTRTGGARRCQTYSFEPTG